MCLIYFYLILFQVLINYYRSLRLCVIIGCGCTFQGQESEDTPRILLKSNWQQTLGSGPHAIKNISIIFSVKDNDNKTYCVEHHNCRKASCDT
jgi:hypothetical protein